MHGEAGGAGSEQACRVMHVIRLLLHDTACTAANVAPLLLVTVAHILRLGLPAVYA
jgi:hypothetical protein